MRQLPKRTKTQIQHDSDIVEKHIFYGDILNNKEAVLNHFLINKRKLSDAAYWEMLRAVWITCGNKHNYDLFRSLFKSNRPFKYYFMTSHDWQFFNNLPQQFTVYRALSSTDDNGLSWSLSKGFVMQYAQKLNRPIISKTINKRDVFAYLNSRNEQEIILL